MAATLALERKVALDAVRQACRLTSAVFNQLVTNETITKKDKSPVTVADYGAQAIINTILGENFPNDPIVGEEDSADLRTESQKGVCDKVVELVQHHKGGTKDSILAAIDRGNYAGGAKGRMWALDPVDGTKGFLRGGQYAVCLALIIDGKVQLGVMGCPNLPTEPGKESPTEKGCVFVAVKGQGAFQSTLSSTEEKKIKMADLTPETLASKATFCESVEAGHSSHDDNAKIAEILGIAGRPSVRMDSQAKYCSIARGDGHIYLRLPVDDKYQEKIWDHASGSLLVAEAGGIVSDMHGNPLDFSIGRTLSANKGVVAAHAAVHSKVISAVQEVVGPNKKL